MEWPEVDGYGYTTSIVHPDERHDFYAILEDCAADILRAPRLGTLIKLGEWFEAIDYTALSPEEWIRHRVRVRLFRSFHRDNDSLLHMRELEWKKTVFATKRELPHICPSDGCDEHYWTNATCFNGFGVNSETLLAVYGLAGQEMDWKTPGRGLELPNDAWELLVRWRQQQQWI